MESFQYLLIIGGYGDFGNAIIETFKNQNSIWKICVIDLNQNLKADVNIIIDQEDQFSQEWLKKIYSELEKFSKYYDAIFDITRAWKIGSIKSPEIFAQTEEMFKRNYFFSILGNRIIDFKLSWPLIF